MRKTTQHEDALVKKIDSVVQLLENLFILQSAKTGFKRDEIRKILGVSNDRVSAVMKHLRKDAEK